ncbi:hypothetical protein SAMN05216503_0233 [Polaribacter sp. KT25b]|uniref:DUF7222 domain-containing protein n=1 Tax=Polaribacter sp. KT25b TaxID=1855336 RepID=UPI00087D7895|nr:hypothetical protein [Polaribacter sp. KT25b]SDR67058.1 hypothetical protein SAMN05216503_0233 [Polaribacter sp. KT25b]
MSTTRNISEKKLKKQLQKVLAENPNTVKACVIQEAFDYHNITDFFEDLLQNGCSSGMISSLIYYRDTEKFFDFHYEEIMDLKTEFEESTGEVMHIPHQLKNHLAWFSFEQVAYDLADFLGLEI